MQKAYFIARGVKAVDGPEERVITGIASTGNVDRMGDVVEPGGIKSEASIPLFLYHDSEQTVGRAQLFKATKDGVPFKAILPVVHEPGRLKDRVDEAWQMLKHQLITGVSIGFNILNDAYEQIKGTNGWRFLETEVLELSLVPIPANADATILTIKSLAERPPAAMGRKGSPLSKQTGPGASGRSSGADPGANSNRSRKGTEMKTLQELLDERQTKGARLTELMELRTAEKRRFSAEEADEFDGLTDECAELDDDIRVKRFEASQTRGARSVRGGSEDEGTGSRSHRSNTADAKNSTTRFARNADPEDTFKGQSYVRLVIAKAMARLQEVSPVFIAEQRWGKSHPNLARYIRAAVAGGGTGSGEWGAELAAADTRYNGDFVEFLYGMTVYDKLPLRVIPENVHIKGQDGGGTGYWVGESKAIPATALDFSDVQLNGLKVAALAVVSNDLLRKSDPAAEQLIRDALGEASSQRIDTTFLSTAAAVAGVSPAGILNGLSAIASAGTDADAIRADIIALYAPFITAKNSKGLWLVTNPSLAKATSLMVNALGQTEFQNLTADGGQLLGDRIITGDNVGAGDLILLSPKDIWKIGDGGVEVSMSRDAMIEQDTAPTGATDTPVAASATLTSMFQTESTAFKVVRRIAFAKRRASAVSYVGDADYGPAVS